MEKFGPNRKLAKESLSISHFLSDKHFSTFITV
jgi:hypothetical protein